MRKFIVFITLLFSVSANAITYYNAPGHALPDEMSPTGLPEVIPCATRKTFEGKVAYECTWLSTSRELRQWDYQQNKEVRFYNQQDGKLRIPRHLDTQPTIIWTLVPCSLGHLIHVHLDRQSERSDAGLHC